MEIEIIRGLELCDSCVIACDGVPEQPDDLRAARLLGECWPEYELHDDCPPDEEDTWFSWQDCDGCGERPGGTRHPGVAIKRS